MKSVPRASRSPEATSVSLASGLATCLDRILLSRASPHIVPATLFTPVHDSHAYLRVATDNFYESMTLVFLNIIETPHHPPPKITSAERTGAPGKERKLRSLGSYYRSCGSIYRQVPTITDFIFRILCIHFNQSYKNSLNLITLAT